MTSVSFVDAPQVKSVKPCLKQLQQCIQTISTLHDDEILPSNPADLFHWLPKEHMCVLVYLVRHLQGLLPFVTCGYARPSKAGVSNPGPRGPLSCMF